MANCQCLISRLQVASHVFILERIIVMTRSCLLNFALAFCFCMGVSRSPALDVGVASCDITPDVKNHKVPMAGYGARKGEPATGVHDPLHAKVLVFRDGKQLMALVTFDLRSVNPLLKKQTLEKTAALDLTADTLFF